MLKKILIAADHAGFTLKSALIGYIETLGYEVEDCGAHTLDAEDDYPDIVTPLAVRVAADPSLVGVIIGGSGQGEAMAANRVQGIRAAVFYGKGEALLVLDEEGTHATEDGFDIIRLARSHNDANVLSLGARFVSKTQAEMAARLFLETPFSDMPRHARRIKKF